MSESAAPVQRVAPEPREDDDERPALQLTRRNLVGLGGFLLASLAGLYFLLPQIAGLDETWNRIGDGRPAWIAAALVFTVGMFAGYVAMFRGVYVRAGSRIGWRASYQITMAGLAASRLFAAGGAGGLVLTAWALRRAGMTKRTVAAQTMAFLVLTYLPYTVAERGGRFAKLAQQLAQVPAATSAGVRDALEHLRSRDPALLGAVLFWAFQIAVLWAAFHAFGQAPPLAVLVQAFFVGMLGNLLPMPGGVGGVEGGMIGALVAFGVNSGLAVVAVLVYRAFTFWLPLLPGVIAYFRLRHTVDEWKSHPAASAA